MFVSLKYVHSLFSAGFIQMYGVHYTDTGKNMIINLFLLATMDINTVLKLQLLIMIIMRRQQWKRPIFSLREFQSWFIDTVVKKTYIIFPKCLCNVSEALNKISTCKHCCLSSEHIQSCRPSSKSSTYFFSIFLAVDIFSPFGILQLIWILPLPPQRGICHKEHNHNWEGG